jgi:hypothetical protein
MATHDDRSHLVGAMWMSAEDIAALSGGRATAGAVRSWWRSGLLEFEVFPELGKKSNKRSRRHDVELFLSRKYGQDDAGPQASSVARRGGVLEGPAAADLIDTLLSVKAAAAAAMDALITEAEAHAGVSRAVADADAKRVESLKHLQTMLRGYDLALSAYVQPPSPALLEPPSRSAPH